MRNEELQRASQKFLERYAQFASHMLTLTMRDHISISPTRQRGLLASSCDNGWDISEHAARDAVRYFITRLNHQIFGRRSSKLATKSKCRIIAIPIIEGLRSYKRTHVHILIGNIPPAKLENLQEIISATWKRCSVAMSDMKLESLYDAEGAAFYLTKEVGYINDDVIDWNIASIPAVLHTQPRRLCVTKLLAELRG